MNLLQKSTLPLCLILFILAGAGCAEQEQKSKDVGDAILNTVKHAEKNIDAAVQKMQEKTNQLDEAAE